MTPAWQELARELAGLIAPLERRIDALEKQPQLRFAGTHQRDVTYQPGEFTVRSGSLWLCLSVTTTTPGLDGSWRLVCKNGSFGPGEAPR